MESGIAKAAKSKFGSDNVIKVEINRENGEIGIFRQLTIVENPQNQNVEISLQQAQSLNEENKNKKALLLQLHMLTVLYIFQPDQRQQYFLRYI